MTDAFAGAKLILFIGQKILAIRRDNIETIPWPNYLDFPGGGRDGEETPEACALRETFEEVGLRLAEDDLVWKNSQKRPNKISWFFAAHLPEAAKNDVVFGKEGQSWELMAPEQYLKHQDAIPHFQLQLSTYLKASGQSIG